MAYGVGEQREGWHWKQAIFGPPWKQKSRSGFSKQLRMQKARRERRRAKHNPECAPEYKRHNGWEW